LWQLGWLMNTTKLLLLIAETFTILKGGRKLKTGHSQAKMLAAPHGGIGGVGGGGKSRQMKKK
jgi:hypothetical protein